MAIEFNQIIAYRGSQNGAFEELVCQTLRRTEAADSYTWVRLDGSGGDGGVEAFWYRAEYEKVGVQAKYFTRSREIDWRQVKHSYKTALGMHPDLREYRVFLACDLTGPTARSGRSGLDRWYETRNWMCDRARDLGRAIEVKLITASELGSILVDPRCAGLRAFWFNVIEVNEDSLKQWLDSSIAALGERFHPEDHVETRSQEIIRTLTRHESARSSLLERINALLDCDRLDVPKAWAKDSERGQSIRTINEAIDAFSDVAAIDLRDPSIPWPVYEWRERCSSLEKQAQSLFNATFESVGDDRRTDDGVPYFREKCRSVLTAVQTIDTYLRSKAIEAEMARGAIIKGPAGAGKSHLLGAAAEETIKSGGICILLLGHRFRDGLPWSQVASQLGLAEADKADLLGTLDAAAQAARRRCVIIVDALNEGPLRQTWIRELGAFTDDVLRFKNLTVVVSCRDVFVPYVIAPDVRSRFPLVTVRGFESDAEQEAAARVFLDRRGISRPSGPWIAPEFVNPLFLRSCTEALRAAGRTAFPTGLIGTKQLLAFYVDAVSRNLEADWGGGDDLATPCKRALLSVALEMAGKRQDWIERDEADSLVKSEFAAYGSPDNQTWLTILVRGGVLRKDPNPRGSADDEPLAQKPDVIRFAFQRFQDHLMAEALLASERDVSEIFARTGSLSFLVSNDQLLSWEWLSLVEALSIQIPERFGEELIDTLPGGFERHWGDYWIEHAFVESVKRRQPDAISKRTLELANRLQSGSFDIIGLLIELAPRVDHPWSALLLDRNLAGWEMPERDRRWTIYVSAECLEDGHPLLRLIEWCGSAPKENVSEDILRLCAITMCWVFTSTAREIRDKATKALASMFVDRPKFFVEMVQRFADVDDLYVLERIVAAGFGSLARSPSSDKARSFADSLRNVFDNAPEHLLLRDYIDGIFDIAENLDPSSEHTRLPSKSKRPALNATETALEKLSKRAGGDQIHRSCTGMGDFLKYEISSPVRHITRVRLSAPPPYTARQLAKRFEEEIERHDLKRAKLEGLRRLISNAWPPIRFRIDHAGGPKAVQSSGDFSKPSWIRRFKEKEGEFLELLSESEAEQYFLDWLPEHLPGTKGRGFSEVKTVDELAAGRWVARRAYGLGWTKARFGKDIGDYESMSRPSVERIGKKYQWIAKSEFLARLVDHYWLSDSWEAGPKEYEKATDLEFERDIDPTLFSSPQCIEVQEFGLSRGLRRADIGIEPLDGFERLEWPFQGDPGGKALASISTVDHNSRQWHRLEWHASVIRYSGLKHRSFGHNFAQHEFHFVHSVLCPQGEGRIIAEVLQNIGHVDLQDWQPPEHTDGPFLYEIACRTTWSNQKWHVVNRLKQGTFRVAPPVEEYQWESHLDKSLPNGARAFVLAPWLMLEADLRLDSQSPQLIRDNDGNCVSWSTARRGDESGLVVEWDWFSRFLSASNLDLLVLLTGEREAWNDGDQVGAAAYRRFNALKVYSSSEWSCDVSWNEDHHAQ